MANTFKFLRKIDPHNLYWLMLFGAPKRKMTSYKMVNDDFKYVRDPVFFLSTGRTGTMWFAKLLAKDRKLAVFHEAFPQLEFAGKYLYEIRVHKNYPHDLVNEFAREMFIAARAEYFVHAYRSQKRYVETNNHLTFFAPVILDLFPSVKFVHVYRHPGDFVRSGLLKGWYAPGHEKNSKLITHPDPHYWQSLSQVQKIAWLWRETNIFIENFKLTLHGDKIFNLDFSNKNTEKVKQLVDFIGARIPEHYIAKVMNKRANALPGKIPPYSQWNDEIKEQVRGICGDLAEKYGYQL